MSKRLKHSTIFILVIIAALSALLGFYAAIKAINSAQGSSISRSEIFNSLEDMSNRADAIVVGTTANSEPVFDIDPDTRFDATNVVVSDVLKGSMSSGDGIHNLSSLLLLWRNNPNTSFSLT